MNKQLTKYAASSLVLALTTVACTPGAQMARPAMASPAPTKSEKEAGSFYAAAQEALLREDLEAARTATEEAVALSPADVAYRMLLADIYLKQGRFASADTAFGEVLALNPDNRRAALSLVLVEIAQGKTGLATLHLEQLRDTHPAADVGLAYALAGQPKRAIELLEPAARAEGADGRIRQNLALAYALDGEWQKARITAGQDVSPGELDARMRQWAGFAQPGDSLGPVAALLGVTPAAADPGRPIALALAAPVSAPALAEAEPAAEPVAFAEAAPVPAAETGPIQGSVEVDQPVRYAAAAQALVSAPVIKAAIEADPAPVLQKFRKPGRIIRPAAKKPVGTSRYVVQIGAYRTPNMVAWAWSNAKARYGLQQAGEPLSTSIELPGRGRFYRLSVAGFDSQEDAGAVCRTIRSKRGACFVRVNGGDTPVQWALRSRSDPRA